MGTSVPRWGGRSPSARACWPAPSQRACLTCRIGPPRRSPPSAAASSSRAIAPEQVPEADRGGNQLGSRRVRCHVLRNAGPSRPTAQIECPRRCTHGRRATAVERRASPPTQESFKSTTPFRLATSGIATSKAARAPTTSPRRATSFPRFVRGFAGMAIDRLPVGRLGLVLTLRLLGQQVSEVAPRAGVADRDRFAVGRFGLLLAARLLGSRMPRQCRALVSPAAIASR